MAKIPEPCQLHTDLSGNYHIIAPFGVFVWKTYCKLDACKGSGKTRCSGNATRGIQMLLSNSQGKIAWL